MDDRDQSPSARHVGVSARQPQLDALRAFAVLIVIWQHTMAPTNLFTADAGEIGVELFFVLSGFLITGILLDARRDAGTDASRPGILRRFYARRFVRIFPLYYALLLVAWLLHEESVRQNIGWLATYTTNFRMAALNANIGLATPFWSLAIEEQFYLFWPCLVLFTPRKRLPAVLIGMAVLSVVSRALTIWLGGSGRMAFMSTWGALDGFAIGGMLALAHRVPAATARVSRLLPWVLVTGMLLIGVRLLLHWLQRGRPIQYGLWMLPWAMVSVWLVDRAARDQLPRLFNWRPLTWIGVVSYGVYIYHRPLMSVFSVGARRGWDVFAFIAIATIAVASVSWIVFERPINNLKRRWPYVAKPG